MIARRKFLTGVGAATAIGFDPVSRSWVREVHAAEPIERLPSLDGIVLFDLPSRQADASDVGNIVHRVPRAVLRPGSVADIQIMVRYCRRFGIELAARGQGHTTQGQSQVRGGLIVEMSSLSEVHSITPESADVDAGLLWKDLVVETVSKGLTPPILTGFTGLSIGGTLSVGGITAWYREGAQVDHVRRLHVVTGEGELVECSRHVRPELFEAALAGLGQYGIIVRATLDLVPARALARVVVISYADPQAFFADLRVLLTRGEFDNLYNVGVPNGVGGFLYQLTAAQFFDPGSAPDVPQLLRGLGVDPTTAVVQDVPYLAYILRVDSVIDQFKAAGLWDGVLHPWFDAFLPDRSIEPFASDVIGSLQPDDVGQTGFLLIFPVRRAALKRPFLRVPDDTEWVYLFDILTAAAAPGPNPEFERRMLERNRRLFEKARRMGGTRYPIGSIQFSHVDWVIHYGEEWPEAVRLKGLFDPDLILTPGPGVFER